MSKKDNKKTGDSVKILHRRYIKDHPGRKVYLQQERINAQVAQLIYDLRKGAGLSQKQLAEMVGTTQSVISRLEDSDYDGHSLSMLERITKALDKQLRIEVVGIENNMVATHEAAASPGDV